MRGDLGAPSGARKSDGQSGQRVLQGPGLKSADAMRLCVEIASPRVVRYHEVPTVVLRGLSVRWRRVFRGLHACGCRAGRLPSSDREKLQLLPLATDNTNAYKRNHKINTTTHTLIVLVFV